MKYCAKCGRQVASEDKFCQECGTPVKRTREITSSRFTKKEKRSQAVQFSVGSMKTNVPRRPSGQISVGSAKTEISPGAAQASSIINELSGEVIAFYRLEKIIDEGASGVLYRAVHPTTRKTVAFKFLRPDICSSGGYENTEESKIRFNREAQAISKLDHQNIVHLHNMGECKGLYFLMMEYVPGRTLARVLAERRRLEWGETFRISRQILLALREAHIHGLLHRDIKPENILIRDDGMVKVTDFGLVKMMGIGDLIPLEEVRTRLKKTWMPPTVMDRIAVTMRGEQVGTFGFMSPEQKQGARDLDQRSDIYSFGMTLYRMLTGKEAIGRVKAPSQVYRDVPFELDNLCLTCIEHDKEDRYKSVDVLLDAMEEARQRILLRIRKNKEKGKKQFQDQKRLQNEAAARSQAEELRRIEDERKKRRKRKFGIFVRVLLIFFLLIVTASGGYWWYEYEAMQQSKKDEQSLRVLLAEKARVKAENEAQEKARQAAEAERQCVEAEKKAAEEIRRRKEESRLKIEAQQKALEEKKQREEAIRKVAEEKKQREEAENKAAVERKKREEEARLAQKAEQQRIEAEQKATEAEKQRIKAEMKATVEKKKREEQEAAERATKQNKTTRTNTIKLKDLLRMAVKKSKETNTTVTVLAGNRAGEQYRENLGNGVILELVWIPPGRFLMGSSASEINVAKRYGAKDYSNESPQHEVIITKGFFMAKYEVTCEQFLAFVRNTNYITEAEKNGAYIDTSSGELELRSVSWRNPGFSQTTSHPVTCVSWNDAQTFCRWLSQLTMKKYRLPQEAEWEYACRAGTNTVFWWGNDRQRGSGNGNFFDLNAKRLLPYTYWPFDDGSLYSSPVGRYYSNPWGLFDILGNVGEWCEDWYNANYYHVAPLYDPKGPSSGDECVVRGGGWLSSAGNARSAKRWMLGPNCAYWEVGFRVVLEATEE